MSHLIEFPFALNELTHLKRQYKQRYCHYVAAHQRCIMPPFYIIEENWNWFNEVANKKNCISVRVTFCSECILRQPPQIEFLTPTASTGCQSVAYMCTKTYKYTNSGQVNGYHHHHLNKSTQWKYIVLRYTCDLGPKWGEWLSQATACSGKYITNIFCCEFAVPVVMFSISHEWAMNTSKFLFQSSAVHVCARVCL